MLEDMWSNTLLLFIWGFLHLLFFNVPIIEDALIGCLIFQSIKIGMILERSETNNVYSEMIYHDCEEECEGDIK